MPFSRTMKLLLVLLLVPDFVSSNTDAGSTKLTKYRAHKAVKSADQNQDGHADQSEFHAHLRQDMAQKHPRLKSGAAEMAASIDSSFAVLDSDHNGIVSKAEATAAKNSYGHHYLEMWNAIDENGDGAISMQEFKAPSTQKQLVDSMKRIFYPSQIAQGVKQLMAVGDKNNDGKLSPEELVAIDLTELDPLLQELLFEAGDGSTLRGS